MLVGPPLCGLIPSKKGGGTKALIVGKGSWDVLSKSHLHFNRGLLGLGREVNNGVFLRDQGGK